MSWMVPEGNVRFEGVPIPLVDAGGGGGRLTQPGSEPISTTRSASSSPVITRSAGK